MAWESSCSNPCEKVKLRVQGKSLPRAALRIERRESWAREATLIRRRKRAREKQTTMLRSNRSWCKLKMAQTKALTAQKQRRRRSRTFAVARMRLLVLAQYLPEISKVYERSIWLSFVFTTLRHFCVLDSSDGIGVDALRLQLTEVWSKIAQGLTITNDTTELPESPVIAYTKIFFKTTVDSNVNFLFHYLLCSQRNNFLLLFADF